MAAEIKYKAFLSSFKKGEKTCYWASPIHNGTLRDEGLVERIATRSGLDKQLVNYIVSLAMNEMGDVLKEGIRLELEDLSGYLTIQGGFPAIDASWDKSVNRLVPHIQAKGSLARCLDGIVPKNVTESATVVIKSVLDTVLKVESVLQKGSNVHVLVSGSGLVTSTSATSGEGCWLENVDTGVVAATGTVTASSTTSLDATFATMPNAGDYHFVVATRGGLDESFGVVLAKRCVKVVEPES